MMRSGSGANVGIGSEDRRRYPPTARPTGTPAADNRSPWTWWLISLVVLGALLAAIGGAMVLHPAGEHLNQAGQNYADCFATRNLALAVMAAISAGGRPGRAWP